ncbi:hypothetical protein B566_EDAN002817 [Ephemera danica]|nr:hypothetical protein B566_EDAN002817 [Ephemera danica]
MDNNSSDERSSYKENMYNLVQDRHCCAVVAAHSLPTPVQRATVCGVHRPRASWCATLCLSPPSLRAPPPPLATSSGSQEEVMVRIVVLSSTPRALLLAALLLAAIASSAQQRIDCRRFVFAPICRGVAAKRSVSGDNRLLHSAQQQQQQRSATELVDDANETYGVPQPSEEPSLAEQSGADVDLSVQERWQMMRPHRERKVLRSRSHQHPAQLRFYYPRPATAALQSDYEQY